MAHHRAIVINRRLIRQVLISMMVLWVNTAAAHLEFYEPFDNANFGLWPGIGNAEAQVEGCVVSTSAGLLFGAERDYQLRAQLPNLGSQFVLTNGSNQLPFSLSVTDLHGSGTQTLTPNNYSDNLTYQKFCFTQGNSARLTLSITQAALYTVPAGTYSATLNLTGRRVGNGGGSTMDTQSLTASIQIPNLIQITNLDDINFGTYDGIASQVAANEAFCIYTNASDYTIRPSSATTGSSPATLAVSNGSSTIDYSVRFNNSADASGGTILENNEVSGTFSANQPSPLSLTCNGSDNAAIYLQMQGSDLQAAPIGNYSGTLNLLVAPI